MCFLLGLATGGLLTGLLEGVSGREGSFGVFIASMVSRHTALEAELLSDTVGLCPMTATQPTLKKLSTLGDGKR